MLGFQSMGSARASYRWLRYWLLLTTTLAITAVSTRSDAWPGRQLWARSSTGTTDRAIATVSDGTNVYLLLANEAISTGQGEVRRYDTGGTLLRTWFIGSMGFPLQLSALAVANGNVFVVGSAANAPFVAAYSGATGARLWIRSFGGGGTFDSVAVSGSTVFVAGTLAGKFYVRALNAADGVLGWTYSATNPSGASALAVGNGRVVVGGYPSFVLRAFSSTGTLLYEKADTTINGQVYGIALDGARAYAAGQSTAGNPVVRALDVVARTQLWEQPFRTSSGSAYDVAVLGGVVYSTGYFSSTSGSDFYVDARDAATGAARWEDIVNGGGADIGLDLHAIGQRVYVVGATSRSNGDGDVLVRAYGTSDGYPHWTIRPPLNGPASAASVTVDASSVYVASTEPNGTSGSLAYLRNYAGKAQGGELVASHSACTNGGSVTSVASNPENVFYACSQIADSQVFSKVIAYDALSGKISWQDGPSPTTANSVRLANLTPVGITTVAASKTHVLGIGRTHVATAQDRSTLVVRAYSPQGTNGAAQILWTDSYPGLAGDGGLLHVEAKGSLAIATGRRNGALFVWAYDLAGTTCPLAGNGPCILWSYQVPGTSTTTWYPQALHFDGVRAAVSITGPNARVVVFADATRNVATAQESLNGGEPYGVAISPFGVFTAGSAQRGVHTYNAAGYTTLGNATVLSWFDEGRHPLDAVNPTTVGGDARGVAVFGNQVYGCGYVHTLAAGRRLVVRQYPAATGIASWKLSISELSDPAPWSGGGSCYDVTADANHVVMTGDDWLDREGAPPSNFLAASFNPGQNRVDWLARPAAGVGFAVRRDGDRAIFGGKREFPGTSTKSRGAIYVYEAICSTHGTETVCPLVP